MLTKKRLVVVSGGTKGIGNAIARKFMSENFDIVICSRSKSDLDEQKQELEKLYANECHIFVADLSKKESVEEFGEYILGLNLPIAALINNAGVFLPGQLIEEPEGQLEIQISTNLYSAYYLTRKLLKSMLKSNQAHIFNICSIASISAYPQSGSYTISKFALLGFSKSLREELKDTNIKVTSLLPGATFTDSWSGTHLPEERFMKAVDIADILWSSFNLSASAVVEEIILRPIKGDI